MAYGIGRVARQLGCTVQTIRYYEQVGLIHPPERTEGGQRRYRETDLERLRFIRHARELGFSLDAIRSLLSLSRHADEPCEAADRIAGEQLANVRSRIARLRALEDELQAMLCGQDCGTVADCRVIEVLSDHALCRHDHPAVPENRPGR